MKWIVFDFDGTLADTLLVTFEAYNEVAPQFHLPSLSREKAEELRGLPSREVVAMLHIPLYKLAPVTMAIKRKLRSTIHTAPLFPGIPAMLRTLKKKGYQVGMLTSNDRTVIDRFLLLHKLDDVFDSIYTGSSLFGKAAVMKKFLQSHHLTAKEVVYIGDETRDIEAAKKVGLRIVSCSWGFNRKAILQQYHPTAVIDGADELITVLSSV